MVDWNPSGVAILSQYKWGGACNAAEEGCDPLPGLHWLAARQHQLDSADPEARPMGGTARAADPPLTQGGHATQAMQPLSSRDQALARSQMAALQGCDPSSVDELAAMYAAGCKAEIEALYSVTGLASFSAALAEDMRALVDSLPAEAVDAGAESEAST